MLDSDLARLYQCKNGTKTINLAVKRNSDRFPEDFYFQLGKEEYNNLKFQFGTSSYNEHGGVRKLPYVFTEQGVAMLSSVLRTDVASKVSIDIMRAFVMMRKYMSKNLMNLNNYGILLIDHENRIKVLENTFLKFETFSNELVFEGQIYDAYSLLLDIFNTSKNEIIIIDNYADKELLDVVSRTNRNVTIISKNMDDILIKKYQKQYSNLTIINNNTFHDRFIIIDKEKLYTCGSSFKDLGKKCFAITLIDDENILEMLLKNIYK